MTLLSGQAYSGVEDTAGGEFPMLPQQVIPEPASALLIAAGLAALGLLRRRRA